jgi:hypothetical protein
MARIEGKRLLWARCAAATASDEMRTGAPVIIATSANFGSRHYYRPSGVRTPPQASRTCW